MSAEALKREIRGCTVCAPHLPLGPRPIVQFSKTSRIAIVGQAPGRITHETGLAFDDRSGERLADWLGVSFEKLHDSALFAIVSMGFCYPGKASGGDKPPRPECAPLWHERIWTSLPHMETTLLVGAYAQRAYLPDTKGWPMRERVERWREFAPRFVPLPHPAWRSTLFMRDNPWFENDLLPALQARIAQVIR